MRQAEKLALRDIGGDGHLMKPCGDLFQRSLKPYKVQEKLGAIESKGHAVTERRVLMDRRNHRRAR